jgi:hypothetical protein
MSVTPSLCFTERTKLFWDWFAANEEKLSEFVQNKKPDAAYSKKVTKFVNEGLALISTDLMFNIGGDHEFTFTVSGNYALFLLSSYVTANIPKQFKKKWTFHPYEPSANKQNRTLQIPRLGISVDSDRIFVSPKQQEGSHAVDLCFYAKELETLDENDCRTAFLLSMDMCIGEALSYLYIENIEKVDALTDDMFPLTKLEEWLFANVCKDGKIPHPALQYMVYRREPSDNPKLRYDILIGGTNYAPLLGDYYHERDDTYQVFVGFGAKPIFLTYEHNNETDLTEELERRDVFMRKLELEVLGKRGSGREIGILLGGAIGEKRVYIDFLLYDEQAFIKKLRKFQADFPDMSCEEFVHSGRTLV